MGIFSRLFGGNGQDGDGEEEPSADAQRSPVLATATAGVAPRFATTQGPASTPTPPREAPVTDEPPAPRARAPLPKFPKRAAPAPAPQPVEPVAAAPIAPVAPAPKQDKHDATVVMSPAPMPMPARRVTPPQGSPAVSRAATVQASVPPPPAAAIVAEPASATGSAPVREPIPPAPVPRWSGHEQRRAKSISEAFELSMTQEEIATPATRSPTPAGAPPPLPGVSTAEDLAAVRGVFNEVAAVHVSQVRDIMLELRYGEANPAWIESTKPALKSLRAMAAQMELGELVDALDAFCVAVGGSDKAVLMQRYQRLIELIPNAFSLDVERDRREPIIIEALLAQIEGVERPTIDKLFAVGLNRLDALLAANVEDLVVIANVRQELGEAIVAHFRAYRAGARSVMSAPDAVAEKKQLNDLLIVMSLQNDDFNRAANGWSDEARAAKRALRKQREQTFQKIKVALARLGEREQLSRLERQSFTERIATLDRYLSSQPRT